MLAVRIEATLYALIEERAVRAGLTVNEYVEQQLRRVEEREQ